MSWNYRIVRYELHGHTHVGMAEVYYDANGAPRSFGYASLLHWETVEELRGTVELMHQALAAPILDINAEALELPDLENLDHLTSPATVEAERKKHAKQAEG
jgi:hypothetical protein